MSHTSGSAIYLVLSGHQNGVRKGGEAEIGVQQFASLLILKIFPHYIDPGLLKLPDIVKLHTCLLFYDILHDSKLSNLHLTFVSEQHNYSTRSVSSQSLQICPFGINIRKFCPSVIGTYYVNDIPQSIRNKSSKQLFKRALQQYYFAQY